MRVRTVAIALLAAAACGDPEDPSASHEALSTAPAEVTLIAPRSTWTYWAGGQDLGTAWRQVDFTPPVAGATGSGPLGYGETYVNPIPFGSDPANKPVTVYFRHVFQGVDAAELGAIRLEVMYDDGFVAYLNGQEIARRSLPGGAITYTTLASGHEAGNSYESIASSLRVQEGANVLAIEIHQQARSSSDLVFDAALRAERAPGPPRDFISANDTWRYWDRGGDLGAAWRAGSYDDSGWAGGQATLGYGDPVTTVISYGPSASSKYITSYFRKQFTVDDPATVTRLFGEILYDDGVVVYLNGQEVLRASMPSGTITATTLARGHEASAFEPFDWSAHRHLLVGGINTVAVEVHQSAASSSDLSFDLWLETETGFPEEDIPLGATWRYWDRGGDPGSDWRDVAHDNADWGLGEAPLGYGEPLIETVISYGPSATAKHITSYFRLNFGVADPSAIGSIQARVLVDDGAIIYVNGHEAARLHMPAGPVTPSTLAFDHEAGDVEYVDLTHMKPYLLDGTNVIAVEVHQASAASSDLYFDLGVHFDREPPPPPEGGIERASVWRYWDRGGDLGSAWRGLGYVFDSWGTGQGPLGYGEPYLNTTVSYGPSATTKFMTTYFRRQFRVDDPAAVTRLTGELMYDDGAVVYLNGTEIARVSMPTGTITAGTRALGHEAGNSYQSFDWSAHRHLLIDGFNVLAVEVHQEAASSSDLVFDAALRVETGLPPPPEAYTVARRSNWRYWDLGAWGPEWVDPSLYDGSWVEAPAPIGYGESYLATTTIRKPQTVYFRKRFLVADTTKVTSMVAELMYDDGVVVWLNGREIARRSMPAGLVTFETLAQNHEADDAYETVDLSIHRNLLRNGTNLLAVEVHQAAPSSSDLVFDAALRLGGVADSDGDRLSDAAEGQAGTDPGNPDTDGDGFFDGDEVLGTVGGLDLPAMGVDPRRKDILIEYDWIDDSLDCGAAHSHRPNPVMLARVTAAFAGAPVANPDGSTGINLIHDHGQGGAFTGGNRFTDSDGLVANINSEFFAHKAANFAPNRQGFFHYFLMPHSTGTGGWGELVGDDVLFNTQGCLADSVHMSGVLMHELGHNLGLHHGGFNEITNYKPNYPSVMNYLFTGGVDTSCNGTGDDVLDYSDGLLAPLDELALDERVGVCNGVPRDWDMDNLIDTSLVAADINFDGARTVLRDRQDWQELIYDFSPAAAAFVVPDVVCGLNEGE